MKRCLCLTLCGALSASALAQFDNSPWPSFKGDGSKRASVTAAGPATELAWTLTGVGIASPGGFTVASNGDIYFKTNEEAQCFVYRVNPSDGTLLATSVDLGGGFGNYGGVAVGVNELYITLFGGAATPSVLVLDKANLNVLRTYADPAFIGMRGTPLIGSVPNINGNVNLYFSDRNGGQIHAVDSVTGQVMWTHFLPVTMASFDQLGPMWTTAAGKNAVAYFSNDSLGPGLALADNGDNTYDILWQDAGPECFNWWGSGALSADESRIYVTTFWDCDNDVLWAIDINDGSVIWGLPAERGSANERMYFGRPAVFGDRIYCAGAGSVVSCVRDDGAGYTLMWEHRQPGGGEFTAVSAAQDGAGNTYVYAVKQEQVAGPIGEYLVLRDDGNSYTEILRTDLNGTMQRTLYGNNSATIDADGSVYVAGGRHDEPANAAVYKFEVAGGCVGDLNGDGSTDLTDLGILLADFGCTTPPGPCVGDLNGDGNTDLTDLGILLADFGCTP
jgi:outer membrane protein assembly factor BamB